jgi:hypothetical protein
VTITDVPTEAIGLDETEVLFREARRRRHRRWIASGIVVCLVTGLALLVSVMLSPREGPGSTYPSETTPVSVRKACQSTQLEARSTSGGGEASQPYVIIAITNNGRSCSISGHPRIVAAVGHVISGGPMRALPITVVDGPDYEHPDPGPYPLIVKQGSAVSFALGTQTASGTAYTISELEVALPGDPAPLNVAVTTAASAFAATPIRLAVTALVPGSAGPPAG